MGHDSTCTVIVRITVSKHCCKSLWWDQAASAALRALQQSFHSLEASISCCSSQCANSNLLGSALCWAVLSKGWSGQGLCWCCPVQPTLGMTALGAIRAAVFLFALFWVCCLPGDLRQSSFWAVLASATSHLPPAFLTAALLQFTVLQQQAQQQTGEQEA